MERLTGEERTFESVYAKRESMGRFNGCISLFLESGLVEEAHGMAESC